MAHLQHLETDSEKMRELLRRWYIYDKHDGYEQLAKEFGACEHPESSVWYTEWFERVLGEPTRQILDNGGRIE